MRNLVHAIERALESDRGGEAYVIGDADDIDLHGFLSGPADAEGFDLGTRSVPAWFARGLGSALETLWRVLPTRNAPPVTSFAAKLMSTDLTMSTRKAREQLG